MKWILKIAPKFLTRLDTYLRINFVWIWATRIHLALYFSLLFTLVCSIVAYAAPVNLQEIRTSRDIENIFFVLWVPAILMLGYFIFQICLFNVDRQHANGKSYRSWAVFPLIMISFCAPFLAPYSVAYLLNNNLANSVEDKTFIEDRDNLWKARFYCDEGEDNYGYYKSENQYLNTSKREYSYFLDHINQNRSDSYYRINRDSIYYSKGIYQENRPKLYRLFRHYDSDLIVPKEKIKRSNEISIDSCISQFYVDQNLHINFDSAHFYLQLLEPLSIKYTNNNSVIRGLNINQAIDELKTNTYHNHRYYSIQLHPNNSLKSNYYYPYYNQYSIPENINDSLHEIAMAKNRPFPRSTNFLWIPILYGCLVISLFVYLFKMINWKQLLLSILILCLLLTIFAMIEAIYRFRGSFISTSTVAFLTGMLLLCFTVPFMKRFNWKNNQAAIVSFLFFPFYFLLLLWFLEEVFDIWHIDYFDQYKEWVWDEYTQKSVLRYSEQYYTVKDNIIQAIHIGGLALFYALGLPIFTKLFMRLQALPKKK